MGWISKSTAEFILTVRPALPPALPVPHHLRLLPPILPVILKVKIVDRQVYTKTRKSSALGLPGPDPLLAIVKRAVAVDAVPVGPAASGGQVVLVAVDGQNRAEQKAHPLPHERLPRMT
jgi:hypothetical protein